MISGDQRFLRRWERWHRRGLLNYVVRSSLLTAGLVLVGTGVAFNFLWSRWAFAEWRLPTEVELELYGVVMVITIVARLVVFLDNEDRYQRLCGKVP